MSFVVRRVIAARFIDASKYIIDDNNRRGKKVWGKPIKPNKMSDNLMTFYENLFWIDGDDDWILVACLLSLRDVVKCRFSASDGIVFDSQQLKSTFTALKEVIKTLKCFHSTNKASLYVKTAWNPKWLAMWLQITTLIDMRSFSNYSKCDKPQLPWTQSRLLFII